MHDALGHAVARTMTRCTNRQLELFDAGVAAIAMQPRDKLLGGL